VQTRSAKEVFNGAEIDVAFAPEDAMLIPRTVARHAAPRLPGRPGP